MKTKIRFLLGIMFVTGFFVNTFSQILPTGMTVVPFYDVNKPGLSFEKDKQSVVGLFEVPGKPQHFLVLGYWGFVWSLYPDTTKKYAPDVIKDYTKKQLADFNNQVRKGWEQGALGAAFDPDFSKNRYFYIIYNKYSDPAQYHTGFKPEGGKGDGAGSNGLVSVERWKLSADFASLIRDTTIFVAEHGTGYGSANIVFGKDGLLYITCDSYSKNSWDSTDYMRKILRIDVSKPELGKLYSIPNTNPFSNAKNPAVKKEIFAYGFRNTYSMTADYLTGKIWGAEVGQSTWEEVNIIQPGKNYGWANGGDGQNPKFGAGIEGPCSQNTAAGGAFIGTPMMPYEFTGPQSGDKKVTCADFTNGTWNFSHFGEAVGGSATAVKGLKMNCIILSPAFRGDPTSPFFGFHFVSDVARNYFVAVKEGVAGAVNVGGLPSSFVFEGDLNHNGITSFGEDSYGNMYVTMLSSSNSGAFAWHDIYRMSHPSLKPLDIPRSQVTPTVELSQKLTLQNQKKFFHSLIFNTALGSSIKLPNDISRVEIYSLKGKRIWSSPMDKSFDSGPIKVIALPSSLPIGTFGVRYIP